MALLYLLPRGALDTLFLGGSLKIASVGKDCSYLPCRGREAQMAADRSGKRPAWERWPVTVGLPPKSVPSQDLVPSQRGAGLVGPLLSDLPCGCPRVVHGKVAGGTSEVGTALCWSRSWPLPG